MDNSFGILLRALRLGYHYSEAHDAYIRISNTSFGKIENGRYCEVYKIDISDAKYLMPSDRGEYICWWDSEDTDEILSYIPLLESEDKLTIYIDADGKEFIP